MIQNLEHQVPGIQYPERMKRFGFFYAKISKSQHFSRSYCLDLFHLEHPNIE